VPTVWIGYEFWQTRYAGSPSVMGTTISIASSATARDAKPLRIAGVVPRRASIPLPFIDHLGVW